MAASRKTLVFFKLDYMMEHCDGMTAKQKREHVRDLTAQVKAAMKM